MHLIASRNPLKEKILLLIASSWVTSGRLIWSGVLMGQGFHLSWTVATRSCNSILQRCWLSKYIQINPMLLSGTHLHTFSSYASATIVLPEWLDEVIMIVTVRRNQSCQSIKVQAPAVMPVRSWILHSKQLINWATCTLNTVRRPSLMIDLQSSQR